MNKTYLDSKSNANLICMHMIKQVTSCETKLSTPQLFQQSKLRCKQMVFANKKLGSMNGMEINKYNKAKWLWSHSDNTELMYAIKHYASNKSILFSAQR